VLDRLIQWSLASRPIVVGVALILLALGVTTALRLPVEVLPDLTKSTVIILTEVPGLAPEEVEIRVTQPLESALMGVAGLTRLRSNSDVSLSLVYAEFDWGSDIYKNRTLVQERLQTAREQLPAGVEPFLTPVASLMGEILLVGVRSIEGMFTASDHVGLARYALGWIDDDGGSLFPLVPWAFYVLAGLGIARITIPDGARTAPRTIVLRLAGASAVSLIAAAACEAWRAPVAEDWSSHPAVLLARTGAVLGMASVLAAIGSRWDLPAWGTTLAGETLALYVVHLLVLFAQGIGPARVWPHALSLEASLALAMAMLALSAAAALGWARAWPPLERRWMPWLRGPLRSASAAAKNEA
jgi:hypothetical protein